MSNDKKPAIRFKDYSDDWEQRKLKDVLVSLQNNTLSRADLSNEEGVAKNVHYGDVLIKFREILDVSKEKLPMISDESILSKYKASFLQNGDVIVADTAEDSTVGKCSEIAGLNDEVVLSGLHTIPYRPIEKFASGYLGYYLNSSAYHNQLIPLMQGIKVTSISKSAMQDTVIVCPKSVEEQGKIGDYLQSLDNLITLHQRKYDKLQNLKKAMLKKMFPKNGSNVPEIRFKGFTDAWEQRKLENILSLENGFAFQSEYFVEEKTGYVVATPGNVSVEGGFICEGGKNYSVSAPFNERFIFKSGDIFVTMTDLTPTANTLGKPAIVPDNGIIYLHNQRLGKLVDYNCNKKFLFALLCTDKYHSQIVKTASGTTVRHSSPDKILSYETFVPKFEEQKMIGKFFSNLDHFIALHQRELEKLKNIKKAMLEKMFV